PLELGLVEDDPARIVRARPDDPADVPARHPLLDRSEERLPPVIVEIDRVNRDPEEASLLDVDRKARGQDDHGAPGRVDSAREGEGGEAPFHRPDRGNAARGREVDVEEELREPGALVLEIRDAVERSVDVADPPVAQRLDLGPDRDVGDRKAGYA